MEDEVRDFEVHTHAGRGRGGEGLGDEVFEVTLFEREEDLGPASVGGGDVIEDLNDVVLLCRYVLVSILEGDMKGGYTHLVDSSLLILIKLVISLEAKSSRLPDGRWNFLTAMTLPVVTSRAR